MFLYILAVITGPDETDPLWTEMQGEEDGRQSVSNPSQPLNDSCPDSALGSSLLSTPGTAAVATLDISRESGEISDDDDPATPVQQQQAEWTPFACYVARSLAERMVLDDPPVPHAQVIIRQPPKSRATIITDRVGMGLTRVDKVIHMQNHVATDFWEVARKIEGGQIDCKYRYVFGMIGLDWCLTANKYVVKEGMKRILEQLKYKTNGNAVLGVCGITPQYDTYATTKVKTVTFNRCLQEAVRDCQRYWRVEFLPLHLHFLQSSVGGQPAQIIQPLNRYFNTKSEFTLVGGMVLREVVMKAIELIPMDGEH